jgi:DNA polymerase elongation subunit (family B)
MPEKRESFWDRIFSLTHNSEREELVLEYITHRLGDMVPLEEIVQEQYVRRKASPEEIEDILDNPRLVEAARKKMEEDFDELSRVLRERKEQE